MEERIYRESTNWRDTLDAKQQKMVEFAEVVDRDFSDIPTVGHNYYLLIAKMSELLDDYMMADSNKLSFLLDE